jgi:hypothetical protein
LAVMRSAATRPPCSGVWAVVLVHVQLGMLERGYREAVEGGCAGRRALRRRGTGGAPTALLCVDRVRRREKRRVRRGEGGWLAWGQAAGALVLGPARWRCAREAAWPGRPRGRRVVRLGAPDCLHPAYGTATGGVSAVHSRVHSDGRDESVRRTAVGRHVDVPACGHARA